MGLSKLCPPVGFCFCLNEWTKAASRALLCLGYSLGLQNASREISSSLVPKYSRRMSENLCPLHHTELVGNGSAFWKRSKTIQSVPFPEVKLCNKTFLKHHYQDLFDTHAVLSDSCPKATWDPSPAQHTAALIFRGSSALPLSALHFVAGAGCISKPIQSYVEHYISHRDHEQ